MTNKTTIKESFTIIILTLIMTFMEMTALPAALFCDIRIKDINPVYFSLTVNFIIAFAICWLCRRFILKEWIFGLQIEGAADGILKYGLTTLIATIIMAVSFCVGLRPFDNTPTALRVVFEGVIYYIGVGIMEELYLRGLLQNIIRKWFGSRKNATLYAILISSLLFGMGHIFGALDQPVATIICKTVWAVALGVFLGSIYVKTNNLWVPIVLHFIINLCGIPFCFSTESRYPDGALVTCLIINVCLGIYGIWIIIRGDTIRRK